MKFEFIINDNDVELLQKFITQYSDNNFVKTRIKRNVSKDVPVFDKSKFWAGVIMALLTTQQKSGPESKVSKFILQQPFPLSYELCRSSVNLKEYVFEKIKDSGLRFGDKISKEVDFNFKLLESGGWQKFLNIAKELNDIRKLEPKFEHIKIERKACCLIQELKGIGPKQSRNLWQSLGLLRYEIPIDSRVIKWLNQNNFPLTLSATGLSDEYYYEFVLNAIQQWCLKANILPCVFDAVVFSSYDTNWSSKYELY